VFVIVRKRVDLARELQLKKEGELEMPGAALCNSSDHSLNRLQPHLPDMVSFIPFRHCG
jgi:hypothetical protein